MALREPFDSGRMTGNSKVISGPCYPDFLDGLYRIAPALTISTSPRSSTPAGVEIEPKFQLESRDPSKKTRSLLLLRGKRRTTYLNASAASTALVIAPMGHSTVHPGAEATP